MGSDNTLIIPFTSFCGGNTGSWKVTSIKTLKGLPLDSVDFIDIKEPGAEIPPNVWMLKGVSSHLRYTNRDEKTTLDKNPAILGKPESICAAMIPLKKNTAWWLLTQDERRRIFEEQSQHIQGTLKYLPIISRKLYHSRDLGELFDFVTWFEFAPHEATQFDELLHFLRSTEEWTYVEREVDIRLIKD